MHLTVLCTLCFVLCELYIKICLPGQYKYWPDVALLMAANGRGHSAALFQLGLTVSASVVDKDCGDLHCLKHQDVWWEQKEGNRSKK